jgi:hypothetical protein
VIFQPKPLLQIFPLEPIQDNDNYKPHAKHYSNLSMFTKLSRKQESVTDGQTSRYYYILSTLSRGDNNQEL